MKGNRYITKPVEVEALEWIGTNKFNMCEFIGDKAISMKSDEDFFIIETLEGNMKASKGDFIIKGLRGEFYPCKPDVFHLKYKLCDEAICGWCGKHLGVVYKGLRLFCSTKCTDKFTLDENNEVVKDERK